MEQNQQKEYEFELDLQEIVTFLVRRIGVILLVGVIVAVFTMVGTKLFVEPQYQSVTKMYVLAKQKEGVLTNYDLQTSSLLTSDYVEIIQSRTVLEDVIDNLNLDISYEAMLSKLEVETTTNTRVITIRVVDSDQYMARDIADEIRDAAAVHIKNVMDSEDVNVVDKANLPNTVYSPSVKKNGILGALLGCVLAVAALMIQYISNDTIKTAEDVEKYLKLSTLGSIPVSKTDVKNKKKYKQKNYKRRLKP